MTHIPINHDPEPIRLFDSNFLEFFTHIHPAVIVIIWLPVAAFFLVREVLNRSANFYPLYIPLGFLVGLFLWTLAEYLLHRFVFHFRPRNPRQERIVFLFHGIHHAQPQCKTRLVMPPVVSIPMAAIFYGLLTLVVGLMLGQPHLVGPFNFRVIGWIYHLRLDALRHAPFSDPRKSTALPQTLPYVTPL